MKARSKPNGDRVSADSNGHFDLADYPTEYLECREQMRHTLPRLAEWRWATLRSTTGRPIEYHRTTQCVSCQAIVRDVINASNGTKTRKITRPTLPVVYRIPRSASVTVYQLRLELMRRYAAQAETIIEEEAAR